MSTQIKKTNNSKPIPAFFAISFGSAPSLNSLERDIVKTINPIMTPATITRAVKKEQQIPWHNPKKLSIFRENLNMQGVHKIRIIKKIPIIVGAASIVLINLFFSRNNIIGIIGFFIK